LKGPPRFQWLWIHFWIHLQRREIH
jgi:hypothetical protein